MQPQKSWEHAGLASVQCTSKQTSADLFQAHAGGGGGVGRGLVDSQAHGCASLLRMQTYCMATWNDSVAASQETPRQLMT